MIKCDPRAKARCPFKNHCCGDEVAYFVEGSKCDKFNQKVLAPPPTNADRIRAMSDEEMAECLYQIGYDNGWGDKAFALEWLQQPAEEDDHANL